ncbi:MAG: hypothetical protein M1828_001111 [Chrysothrix sp. TS-e1954]|nr:MAG: hypothetical protein M1828_001111 [Chrysothrix sp. TS-e1954]
MQFKNTFLAAVAASGAVAQMSICDKYTTALLKQNTGANQYTLLSLLVNTAVIGNYTGPSGKGANAKLPGSKVMVPGILAPGMYGGEQVNLLPYFNGKLMSTVSDSTGMATSMNFLDGGGADTIIANATSPGTAGSNQAALLSHLYQYFGAALGCTQYGKMGFPTYAGNTNMAQVHKYMDLTAAQNNYFIQQVGLAATSFGASMSDVTMVANLLNKTFNYRCSPPAAVLPSAPKQLQAICQAPSCPLSPGATCDAYPAAVMPKMAGASSNSSSTNSSGTAMPSGSSGSSGSGSSGSSGSGSGSGGMSGSSTMSGSPASSTNGASVKGLSGAAIGLAGLVAAVAL